MFILKHIPTSKFSHKHNCQHITSSLTYLEAHEYRVFLNYEYKLNRLVDLIKPLNESVPITWLYEVFNFRNRKFMQLYGLILHHFSVVAITRGRMGLMGKRAQDYIEIIKAIFISYFFLKNHIYISAVRLNFEHMFNIFFVSIYEFD